jgi:hypothetical protein
MSIPIFHSCRSGQCEIIIDDDKKMWLTIQRENPIKIRIHYCPFCGEKFNKYKFVKLE